MSAAARAQGVLTYFVNELRVGEPRHSLLHRRGARRRARARRSFRRDLRDDEIVINQWLADDLPARPGDRSG